MKDGYGCVIMRDGQLPAGWRLARGDVTYWRDTYANVLGVTVEQSNGDAVTIPWENVAAVVIEGPSERGGTADAPV